MFPPRDLNYYDCVFLTRKGKRSEIKKDAQHARGFRWKDRGGGIGGKKDPGFSEERTESRERPPHSAIGGLGSGGLKRTAEL